MALVVLSVVRVLAVARGDVVTALALLTPDTAISVALEVLIVFTPVMVSIFTLLPLLVAEPPQRGLKAGLSVLTGVVILFFIGPWWSIIGHVVVALAIVGIRRRGFREVLDEIVVTQACRLFWLPSSFPWWDLSWLPPPHVRVN